jgi:ribonuclease E
MAIAQQNINSEDDFLNVGPDATTTFDGSPSNPTERAGSENLSALDSDEDDLEDEDLDDEDEDDEEDDDEEEEEEIDDEEEEEDEEDVEADDHDLAKGPRAPSVYRKS